MAAGAPHMSTNTPSHSTTHSTMSSQAVVIKQADFIESIADSLQYISYYHPKDFVDAMTKAYEREESTAAKEAIGQILIKPKANALYAKTLELSPPLLKLVCLFSGIKLT